MAFVHRNVIGGILVIEIMTGNNADNVTLLIVKMLVLPLPNIALRAYTVFALLKSI
jgi:hypothetical protein